jgi:hypothetical protein
VDPILDPLLLRITGSAGKLPRTSGPAAKNSDHETTEAVQSVTTKDNVPLHPSCLRGRTLGPSSVIAVILITSVAVGELRY